MSNFVTVADGARIFYKDWGTGQPIVFAHGWPLSADAWDPQMLFMGQNGFRVIAHDRRSHGRSSQTWDGNNMDTYADDLAAVIEALDLKDAILVGHSTGGGEVAHYIGRHGSKRVAKVVLVGAAADAEDRCQPGRHAAGRLRRHPQRAPGRPLAVLQDLTTPFFGANRDGNNVTRACVMPLHRPPRQQARGQGGPGRRGAAADAEDRCQPGRHAAGHLRRHPQGHRGDRSFFRT